MKNSQSGVIFLSVLATLAAAPGAFAQQTPRAQSAGAVIVQTAGSYLGIGVEDIDAERARNLKLKDDRGALVSWVMENGPAAKAGLREGDVILDFNGQPVQGMAQLQRMVRETPSGRQAKLGIWRNGASQSLTATMESARNVVISRDGSPIQSGIPMPPMPPLPPPVHIDIPRYQTVLQSWMLGVETEGLADEPQFAEFLGVKEGVLIKSVMKDSPAEKAGLKAGDVLIKIDDSKTRTTADVTSALRSVRAKDTYNVTLVRNKKEMTVMVTMERRGGLKLSGTPVG